MNRNIETFINDLLHINSIGANKLLDLDSPKEKTFYLFADDRKENAKGIISIISGRIGKIGNTVLRGSALMGEQQIGVGNALDWEDADGEANPKNLDAFIKDVYKEIDLKGNNPLFLSVGSLNWRLATTTGASAQLKNVQTPLLIFPIRLIRSVATRPIVIEFIDDSIYVNPCLIAKLGQIYGNEIVSNFPKVTDDEELSAPVKIEALSALADYLHRVKDYIDGCRGEDTLFSFDINTVAISKYNHDEICMYYDIQKNKDLIYSHPLVERVFSISNDGSQIPKIDTAPTIPSLVLDYDSNQERMINRILGGESLIIKGPPGTGKTLTIANTVAALLSQGKKVMLISKKPAALSEVYKKLPEELRPFLMLLDCETETQAANLSPAKIKADFSGLLRLCSEKNSKHGTLFEDRAQILESRSEALRTLSAYYEENFLPEKLSVLGYSYYDALEKLLLTEGLKTIEYSAPEILASLTREQFNSLKEQVKQIGQYFLGLCGKEGGEHSPLLCPYYTFSPSINDADSAIKDNEKLKEIAIQIRREASKSDIDLSSYKLKTLSCLIKSKADEGQLQRVKNADAKAIESIRKKLSDLTEQSSELLVRIGASDAVREESLGLLKLISSDKSLTAREAKLLKDKESALTLVSDKNESSVLRILKQVAEKKEEIVQRDDAMRAVFKAELSESEIKQIDDAYKALSSYVSENATTAKMFDFAAKKAYSSLAKLSYLSSPTFSEIVAAANERHEAYLAECKINSYLEELTRIFRAPTDIDALPALECLFEKSASVGVKAGIYFKAFIGDYVRIKSIFDNVNAPDDTPLSDIERALLQKSDTDALLSEVKAIVDIPSTLPTSELIAVAENLLSTKDFLNENAAKDASVTESKVALDTLFENEKPLAALVDSFLSGLERFGKEHFTSYYTKFRNRIILSDLDVFISEASDRDLVSYSNNYISHRKIDGPLSLYAFFLPFESGREPLPKDSFVDIFEHSTLELALRAVSKRLSIPNGRGKAIERATAEYCEKDIALRRLNVEIIQSSLIGRIDPKDSAFAFLNSENDSLLNLRKIFKNHSSAIMKLKSCFLLSPSTVSVLFGKEEFSTFDVAIVDEASQLEPTSILPILIRCKQCVFVGDEYQMPPIAHFTPKSEHTVSIGEDDSVILPPETSLLNLAIQSNHFNVEKLQCHFRSNTESLIAFSQKRYYPYMRTFPAAVPKAEGLGFKDVYVEDGECSGGKNDREARAVIRELYDHFDRYFDEKSGRLLESVGVVAFGESQLELITKYVQSNEDLKSKIDTAIRNFNDHPEKLVFFKTVETVQGQETDHLILSFTYSGTSHFGDLSRHSIGECIFNVAVTRARSSITMIHSIRYSQTNNETISDYLELSERFAKDSTMQFISDGKEDGFIKSVKKCISDSLDIAPERIVTSFGATEGSIRIPLVILSEDLSRALIGIFCEKPFSANAYIDESIRYYNILKSRGWELYRVRIHDWVSNRETEKDSLIQTIRTSLSKQ